VKKGIKVKLSKSKIQSFSYEELAPLSHRKKFAQYFTPTVIADEMATWVMDGSPKTLLDPAVGTGNLVNACMKIDNQVEVCALDIDKKIIEFYKNQNLYMKKIEIINTDFIKFNFQIKYDGVISNPPYLRHNLFNYSDKIYSSPNSFMSQISKTSNIYIIFLDKILSLLNDGGRAAVIVPTDWMNANYGLSLKKYLLNSGTLRKITFFDNSNLVFEDNLSTACILYFENTRSNAPFEVKRVHFQDKDSRIEKVFTLDPKSLIDTDKWSPVFKEQKFDSIHNLIELNLIAKSRRGIATGANSYFHVSASKVKELGIDFKRTRKCIGKSKDVNGLIFSDEDFKSLEDSGHPTRLLDLNEQCVPDLKYIKAGLKDKLNLRYLLANRDPWFSQELREPSQIWVGVFGRSGIKFVWNESKIFNLTSFHCLYVDLEPRLVGIMVAVLNSTMLQEKNKIFERSYGNGLRKVEPKDVLDMLIPDLTQLNSKQILQILSALKISDTKLRNGLTNWRQDIDTIVRDVFSNAI
jgi:adenine-specific DNA-methyltransferase